MIAARIQSKNLKAIVRLALQLLADPIKIGQRRFTFEGVPSRFAADTASIGALESDRLAKNCASLTFPMLYGVCHSFRRARLEEHAVSGTRTGKAPLPADEDRPRVDARCDAI